MNNLGAETRIEYATSTEFYLADKAAGIPSVTRLPFPVHVVKRVETYDDVSRNRPVTRYAYHHGYYDGVERESEGSAESTNSIPKNSRRLPLAGTSRPATISKRPRTCRPF